MPIPPPGAVGNLAVANATTAATVPLPGGYSVGDFLVCFSWGRATAGTLSSSWTHNNHSTSGNFRILTSYRVATGSDPQPVVTPSGMSGAQKHMHRVVAFSGVDTANPWGGNGTFTQNASQANVGPIPEVTATAAGGAVLVIGCKLDLWTSAAILSGDGLTWSELVDDTDNTIGNGLSTVLDFAPWSGGAPTLTAKTFAITGGASQVGGGMMMLLNAAADAISGNLSATLGSLTASADGDLALNGALSATLGALTLTSPDADLSISGSLAASLGSLALTADADLPIIGGLAVTLGVITVSADGDLALKGNLAQTLGVLAASIDGDLELKGVLSVTLGALALTADGDLLIQGNLTAPLGALTIDAAGDHPVAGAITGDLAAILGAVSLSAGAGLEVNGALTATLGAITLSSSGDLLIGGDLAGTLGTLSLSSSSDVFLGCALAATLGALGLGGDGALSIQGSLTCILGGLAFEASEAKALTPGSRPVIRVPGRLALRVSNDAAAAVVPLSNYLVIDGAA